MTTKVVINDGLINYGLSKEAYDFLGLDWEREVIWPVERISPGMTSEKYFVPAGMAYKNDRTNPKLVACVEKLGEKAGVPGTYFQIVEIKDGDTWEIVCRELGGEEIIIYLGGK